MKASLCLLVAALLLQVPNSTLANSKNDLDILFKNGLIYTVDANSSTAECLGVKGKVIAYVGECEGANAQVNHATKVIDLNGKTLLPGFIDSHMHPLQAVNMSQNNYLIEEFWSAESTLNEIKNFVEQNPERTAFELGGYQISVFIEQNGRAPEKTVLDQIEKNKPMIVIEKNVHSAWVNSAALRLARIDQDTPDPVNGKIGRLNTHGKYGEPNGQLYEEAVNLVLNHFPDLDEEKIASAFLERQVFFSEHGLTTIHDMGSASTKKRQKSMYSAANQMAASGSMNVRLLGSWIINPAQGPVAKQIKEFSQISDGFNKPHFQVRAMKFMVDGIVEEKTALLERPYCESLVSSREDCRGVNHGFDLWSAAQQNLGEAFKLVEKFGYQINAHVIGDAAAKKAIDAIAEAKIPHFRSPSLEHIQLIQKNDILRMAELGISANMTPLWMGLDDYFSLFYYPHLGFDRAYNDTYFLNSMFAAGINVTAGSDWIVTDPDIPFHLFTGITRLYPKRIWDLLYSELADVYPYIDDLNRVFTASDFVPGEMMPITALAGAERVNSIDQMIRAVTINGARGNLIDHITGSLEVGKMADLVVLDRNVLEISQRYFSTRKAKDLQPLAEAVVEKTFFEGRQVWPLPSSAQIAK